MEVRKFGSECEGEEVDIVDVVGWFCIVVDWYLYLGTWIESFECGMRWAGKVFESFRFPLRSIS
jgi:hypothetical protein